MRLTDSDLGGGTVSCYGTGGFSDMKPGAQVVVKDAAGKIIAQGALGDGVHPTSEKYAGVVCEFPLTVENVPDSDFYQVSVGHRGEISHTRAEMEQSGWTVGFTLG